MIEFKNPIKMSKVRKMTNLQFHWSWGLSYYLIRRWNMSSLCITSLKHVIIILNVSLHIKILILNSIGGWNHSRFPMVHEGWKGHWLEGGIFTIFVKQRDQGQVRVMEIWKKKNFLFFIFLKKRKMSVKNEK